LIKSIYHSSQEDPVNTKKIVESWKHSITEFEKYILDPNVIDKAKKIIQSSVVININEEAKIKIGQNLLNIVQNLGIETKLDRHFTFQQVLQEMQEIEAKTDWKLVISSKSQKTQVFTRKYKESPILQLKALIELNDVPIEKVYAFLQDPSIAEKEGVENAEYRFIEKMSDVRSDWTVQLKAIFPIAAREFVFAFYSVWSPKHAYVLFYSIDRPDIPKKKKIIRGIVKMYYSVTPLNEKGSLLTRVAWMDFKGNVPAWFINSLIGKGTLNQTKKLKKYFSKH